MDDTSKCEECTGLCESTDGVCKQCLSSNPAKSYSNSEQSPKDFNQCKNGMNSGSEDSNQLPTVTKHEEGKLVSSSEDSDQYPKDFNQYKDGINSGSEDGNQPTDNKHKDGEVISSSEENETEDNAHTLSKLLDNQQRNEIRLVLVGKTGVGKSETGNTILGKKRYFKSKMSPKSVTVDSMKGEREFDGRKIFVVDTPGLFDNTHNSSKENKEIVDKEMVDKKEIVDKEIAKCINMSLPGPNAFLLVVQFGRFTDEDCKTFSKLFDMFGNEMEKFAIIILTKLDDIEADDSTTFEEFISESTPELHSFFKKCNNRIIPVNNKATYEANEKFLTELLRTVNEISESNGGRPYTNEMYMKAVDALRKKIEEADRKKKEDEEKEKKKIEEKYIKIIKDNEEKNKTLQEQQENEKAEIQSTLETFLQEREKLIDEAKQAKSEKERIEKEKEAERILFEAETLKKQENDMQESIKKLQNDLREMYERNERQKDEEIRRVLQNQKSAENQLNAILKNHSEDMHKLIEQNQATIAELTKVVQPVQPNVLLCTIS